MGIWAGQVTLDDLLFTSEEMQQIGIQHLAPIVDISGHADMTERVGLFESFVAEFEPLLGHTPRWEGFCFIVRELLSRDTLRILETGTLRKVGNWAGDGCSTKIWDWIKEHKVGDTQVVSVDSSRAACTIAQAECPHVHVMHEDSIVYLRQTNPKLKLDLLYLDSYDYHPGLELNACMHQVAELAAIWERLPSGCLIASDDSHNSMQGKPVLTRRLLSMLFIEPLLDSYIVVWKKP